MKAQRLACGCTYNYETNVHTYCVSHDPTGPGAKIVKRLDIPAGEIHMHPDTAAALEMGQVAQLVRR